MACSCCHLSGHGRVTLQSGDIPINTNITAQTAASTRKVHIPEVEGLRAILSMIVLFSHATDARFGWPWGAMEMFFVISGYLITDIVLVNSHSSSNFLSVFMGRRITRIFPLYFVVLLVNILMSYAFSRAGVAGFCVDGAEIARHLTLTQTMGLYDSLIGGGPHAAPCMPGYIHSWSVVLEEQFYLISALLAPLFIAKNGRPGVGYVCALLMAPMLAMLLRALGLNWWTLPARWDGFALGSLVAVLMRHPDVLADLFKQRQLNRERLFDIAMKIGGVLSLAFFVLSYFPRFAGPSWDTWGHGVTSKTLVNAVAVTSYSVFGFGVLGKLLLNTGAPGLAWLRGPRLDHLSRISYSTYLWQIPLIVCAQQLCASWGYPMSKMGTVIGGLLTLPLAHVSYSWIERPALEWGRRFRFKRDLQSATGARSDQPS